MLLEEEGFATTATEAMEGEGKGSIVLALARRHHFCDFDLSINIRDVSESRFAEPGVAASVLSVPSGLEEQSSRAKGLDDPGQVPNPELHL